MAVSAQGCRAAAAASTTLGCCAGGVCWRGPTEAFSFLAGSARLKMLEIENDVYRGEEVFACAPVPGEPAEGGDFLPGLTGWGDDVLLMGWNDKGPVALVVVVDMWWCGEGPGDPIADEH